MLFVASLLALVSSVWQHIAAITFARTAKIMAYGSVQSEVGSVAISLGWVSLAFCVLAFGSMVIMMESIRVLDLLTDD